MISLRSLSRSHIKSILLKTEDRSIRRGSNFQRPRFTPMPQEQMRALRLDFIKNSNNMTTEKWQNLREDFIKNFKHINRNNVDATILGLCNEPEYLPLAKDYIQYLQNNSIEPNTATLGRLLRVYNAVYQKNGSLTKEEEDEVLQICDKIQTNHDILDSITCEHLIHGLVTTQHQWKKVLNLLKMLKLTASPSISVYIQIIMKTFSCKEFDLGWTLLEEMVVEQEKLPKCELYISFVDVISNETEEIFRKHFQKLLKSLEKHNLMLSYKVASHLEEIAKNPNLNLQAKRTEVNRIGKCLNCGNHLKNVAISEPDYNKLRDSFLQKVLIRNDVFQKSSPEEIEHFKRYVDETAPYDCVIDGLNVAFSKGSKRSQHEFAELLISVVRYFKKQQKRVLVLGRKHMNKWPTISMKYLRQHACVYLTNDLTQDDPFMLYATLKSGQSTDFFTRDLMRSHAHLLGSELKSIFRRWQQEHQYSLVTQTNSGKIIIKEPVRHLICAHEVNNTWHLPLTPVYTPHTAEIFELPESWLCLQFKGD